ncbi:hypothetical protein LCGC14_1763630 [marine sediment metagenome]|uniref:Uncharacterized protein n=1 Tax=marine sediment metagenome TaxID=412755 RepID=A0A0F9JF99_9ZZZZ
MGVLDILKTELAGVHPDTGAYDADNAIAANQLNAVNRKKPKDSLTGNELFTATDSTEFMALSDVQRALWVSWCNTDRDPYDAANVTFVTHIFGAGSATIITLQVLRQLSVSRAVELGIGFVRPGNVMEARL